MNEGNVIVGVGNPMRGDDAVGPAVAAGLRALVPHGVRVVQCEGEPTALMDAWAGARRVILVDAVTSAAPPGSVVRMEASEEGLPARLFARSTHLVGIVEAIELARALGTLPEQVVVYGVEAGTFVPGEALSRQVAHAVEVVTDRILAELHA